MKFDNCVKSVSTFLDLKRFANEYVIDFKRLSFDELKAAVEKTAPQYSNEQNLRSVVNFFVLNENRNTRILFYIIVRSILLNCDDFTESSKMLEDRVISYEQKIVDMANEFALNDEIDGIDFYRYVVEAAWENNDDVSVDEQNLINKIKEKIGISEVYNQILEAQIGRFPTKGNVLHKRDDVTSARRLLQTKGIVLSIRDSNGVDYDVIPEEIAATLRKIFNIDIKESSF